jgi:hypothetical protein
MNDKVKCITFDKAAQDALPEHIKTKMKAAREREEARRRYERTGYTLDNTGRVRRKDKL